MALVLTKDGKVRPLELGDLKDVAARDERICQLEALNALLAEQVDRMRPVVNAARVVASGQFGHGYSAVDKLIKTVRVYDVKMAQLAKECE